MERLIPSGKVKVKSSDQIGFSRIGIGFEKLDRKVFDPEKAYDKVAALGVKWARLQSGWVRCETEKGVYDFAWLDQLVDRFLSLSIQPWLNVSYGNPLYTECAKRTYGAVGCPPINSEEAMNAWLSYVKALVRHFEGRVVYYEIWNEPDCNYSWKHDGEAEPRPDGTEYGIFCRETAKAIREVSTTAKIMGFGLSNLVRNLSFVSESLDQDLLPYLDAISYHSYSVNDFSRRQRIEDLRSLCRFRGKDLEIVQGETGSQSSSRGAGAMHGFAWTPELQRKHLLRNMIVDLAADVTFTSHFTTVDMIEALRGIVGDKASYLDYGYFGVLGADFDEDGRSTGEYTPKPSYYALQNMAALFQGEWTPASLPVSLRILPSRRVNGEDCSDPTVLTYGFLRPDGSAVYAYWNSVPLLTHSYRGTVSFFVDGTLPLPRLIDPADGTVYQIPETMTEPCGGGILLKNLPITDVPLLLCFGEFAETEA